MKTEHHFLLYVYSSLLRLYPNAFRQSFAAEMEEVFAARLADASGKGGGALIGFALHETYGLGLNLTQQHWLALQQRLNPGGLNRPFDIETTPGIMPATHPGGQQLAAWLHGRAMLLRPCVRLRWGR